MSGYSPTSSQTRGAMRLSDTRYWPKMSGNLRKQRTVRILPGGYRDLKELLRGCVEAELDRRYGERRDMNMA